MRVNLVSFRAMVSKPTLHGWAETFDCFSVFYFLGCAAAVEIGVVFYIGAVESHLGFLLWWPGVCCVRLFDFEILSVVEADGIFEWFSFGFGETFFRSFVSLFRCCDLDNNGTSHQLLLGQVPCAASMIAS